MIWEFFTKLLDTSGFVPLRESGRWPPELIWLHNVSDALIWIAYLAIPGVLIYFVRRRRDVPFPHMFWLFGAFIFASGFTHFLEVHTFYYPVYRLSGLVKALTAVFSWVTVLALIPVAPRALAMRFPEELEAEIDRRKTTEDLLKRSQEDLRQQTRVLRLILNSMGDGVVVADATGHLLLTNPAAKRLLGAYPLGLPPMEDGRDYGAFLPDGRTPCPPSRLPLSRAIRGETVNRAQLFVRHSTAPRGIWLSANGRPLRDEDGAVQGGVVVLRDITERKVADEELQRRQKQLVDAQQLAHVGSWEWDAGTNRVLWSDELYRLVGKEPQEFDTTYNSLIDRVHPDDRRRARKLFERAYRKGTTFNEHIRVIAADGSVRTLHCRGDVIADEEGRPRRLLGTCQDVTEAKRQEAELQETNRTLAALLQASPVGIFVLDEQGRVATVWNRAAERMFGWTEGEVLGRRLPIVSERQLPEFQGLLRSAFAGDELVNREVRRQKKDGSAIDVSVSTAPLHGPDGRIDRIVAVAADISDRKRAEQRLRESELLFRSVWKNSTDAMQLADEQGTLVAVNGAFCRLVEMDQDALIGKPLAIVYGQTDHQEVMARHRRRFCRRLGGDTIAHRVALRSGERRDLEVAFSFIEFDTRGPLLLSVIRDVTERTRAEREIRKSQNLLAVAQQIAHIGSWEWTIPENQVTWSDELYRIYGLSPGSFDGAFEGFLELVHPEDRQEVRNALQATYQNHTPFSLNQRILRADGVERILHARGEVALDEHGQPFQIIGTCQDITEAKLQETALRESEERFRLLVEGIKDYALFMLDNEGIIISWNAGAERINGYRAHEILGRHFSTFYTKPEIATGAPQKHLARAAAEGNCEVEGWRLRKDGSRFWATVLMTALHDESGRLRGFAKLTRDTTELRDARDRVLRSERLAAIGQMITGLAHESRNALQRSQACLERLKWKCEARSEELDLISRVQQAQRDLHHTYEEVRQYAAPIKPDCQKCHVGAVLKQVWDELVEMQDATQATIAGLDSPLDLECEIDTFGIKQVFRNVLENSFSACDGTVEIAVNWREARLGPRPALRVSICDNGPGLTSEQAERLFEPFYTTKTRGTGLGMAIARRIVESHSGEITAGRTNRPGAEIIVTLPRRQL